MNFDNDPIGQKVEAEMRNLRQRGVQFADSSMYNRTFEAFYSLHQQLAQAEEKASVAPSAPATIGEPVLTPDHFACIVEHPELYTGSLCAKCNRYWDGISECKREQATPVGVGKYDWQEALEKAAHERSTDKAINGVDGKIVRGDFKAGAEWAKSYLLR